LHTSLALGAGPACLGRLDFFGDHDGEKRACGLRHLATQPQAQAPCVVISLGVQAR
jgi:hypothetical protein